MDSKSLLTIVLAGLVGILAKGMWDAAPVASTSVPSAAAAAAGAPPAAASASVTATPAAATAGSKPAVRPPGTASTALATAAPVECPRSNPVCQIERDFPGAYAPPGPEPGRRPLDAPVGIVVASLPNPTATGFPTQFDRAVEAIQRSAQSQRYVIQGHWFPWSEPPGSADKGKPGWLLFRRDGKASVELLLFLVASERPASGVDISELTGALDAWKSIVQRSRELVLPGPLLLLGPTFSGSAVSLEQRLRLWCAGSAFCRSRKLVAVSGSATRRHTQKILQGLSGVFLSSEYHATVLPDDVLLEGMRRFLSERLDVHAGDIAELTEATTDYGNAIAVPEAGSSRGFGTGIKIPFPLQIAVLSKGKAATIPLGPDLPGAFDGEVGAKTELLLDSTFATLSRHGVNHVGVIATSARDKVYLIAKLRKFAPNLRVHSYEGSVEVVDKKERQALEGVVVASSYPMFSATQLWTKRTEGVLQQFPSDAAEGIYNAVLILLSKVDPQSASSLGARLLDYVSPFCPTALPGPSAWVSVSIAGHLWPLAGYPPRLPPQDGQGKTGCDSKTADSYIESVKVPEGSQGAAGQESRTSPSFLTLLGAVAVLLLLVANFVGLFGLPPWWGTWWRSFLVTWVEVPDTNANPLFAFPTKGPQHGVAVLGLWTLTITAVVMAKIFRLPSDFPEWVLPASVSSFPLQNAIGYALQTLSLLLVMAALLISWCEEQDLSSAVQLLACLALVYAIANLPDPALIANPDGHAYFFYLRAIDPGIGLTPTIPLFLVGMAIYIACLLRLMVIRRAERLTGEADAWASDTKTNAPPSLPAGGPPAREARSFDGCAVAMREFAVASSRSLLPVCFVGSALGFIVLFWSLGSLEGRGFDGGCSLCFAVIFTLTLAAAWRAHLLWQKLKNFTSALAMHPAAAALGRLPISVAQTFRSPVPGQVGRRHIATAVEMIKHALSWSTGAPTIRALLQELDDRWFKQAPSQPPAGAPAVMSTVAGSPTPEQRKEDYLALRMAEALGLMCDATRTMLFIATGCGLAALLGSVLYPFQPAATLAGAGLLSVGLVVVVALRVLLGTERDQVLSQVAQTSGKATPSLGLTARLVGYVIVPLGGLIGSRLQDPGTVLEMFKELTKTLNR